jgi:hypothetical protein
LPDNIHIISNGRLYISVTKIIDGSNTVCENFASKAELIHAITSSAFIPVFSGHLPGKYRGQRVIDGGFSSNLIQLSDKTITVAPFAGDANICPMDDSKTREWDVHRVSNMICSTSPFCRAKPINKTKLNYLFLAAQ